MWRPSSRSASGQQRVNELFRRAQRMRVSRTVVATVAMQDDYMKRVRGGGGARDQLRAEGIVIFGDYAGDQVLASALGLPRPGPGEFVSARLVPRPAGTRPGRAGGHGRGTSRAAAGTGIMPVPSVSRAPTGCSPRPPIRRHPRPCCPADPRPARGNRATQEATTASKRRSSHARLGRNTCVANREPESYGLPVNSGANEQRRYRQGYRGGGQAP